MIETVTQLSTEINDKKILKGLKVNVDSGEMSMTQVNLINILHKQ